VLRANTKKGFTLIEILISGGIAVGVLILVTYFSLDIMNFGLFLGDRLEAERELEQTLRIFITEVRSMEPSENGSYPIAASDDTSFTFFTDLDGDGDVEQVRYFLSGTTLLKGVIEPEGVPATYPLAEEVVKDVVHYVVPGSNIFTYWGQGWVGEIASLSAPVDTSDIRLLRMRSTVDRDTTELPAGSTQSIHVTIRNLRGEI
jgi:type II secretory pathway pseudopilin PulG